MELSLAYQFMELCWHACCKRGEIMTLMLSHIGITFSAVILRNLIIENSSATSQFPGISWRIHFFCVLSEMTFSWQWLLVSSLHVFNFMPSLLNSLWGRRATLLFGLFVLLLMTWFFVLKLVPHTLIFKKKAEVSLPSTCNSVFCPSSLMTLWVSLVMLVALSHHTAHLFLGLLLVAKPREADIVQSAGGGLEAGVGSSLINKEAW